MVLIHINKEMVQMKVLAAMTEDYAKFLERYSFLSGLAYKAYFLRDSEPLTVSSMSLEDCIERNKFRVKINGRDYDDKLTLRKIVRGDNLLFVECYYKHKGVSMSHWVWFDDSCDDSTARSASYPVGEQSFSCNDTHLSLLYKSGTIVNTTSFIENMLYFVVTEQQKSTRIVRFNAKKPKDYEILGRGIADDDPVFGLCKVDEAIIAVGGRRFYLLEGKTFRAVGETCCIPRITRTLPEEGVILYSDGSSSIHMFCLGGLSRMKIDDGPIFEVADNGKITLCTLLKGKIQLTTYRTVHDLFNNDPMDQRYSGYLGDIRRLIVLNKYVLAMTKEGGGVKLHSLDIESLSISKNAYSINDTQCGMIEFYPK